MMHGYNFTERTRAVLVCARAQSARLHHEYVGTEHLLLGLLDEGGGVAYTVLESLGADPEQVRTRIEAAIVPGKRELSTGPDLPYTSRAKKVLELAMSEASELHHSYVGTEHLLLGIVREKNGIAAQVLQDMNLTLEDLRRETQRLLGTGVRDAGGASRRRGTGTNMGASTGASPGAIRGTSTGTDKAGAARAAAGSTALRAIEVTFVYEDDHLVRRSFSSPAEAIIFLDEVQP
ncbi:MAG TPA: Clp protease N-terminal domain-containing protein [Gemmatimonadaceae bacterium]|nr:Clp protease N-terminal domain-containing protein [Gemmatimonadaceae bacterium]